MSIDLLYYRMWYQEDVRDNLSEGQKEAVLNKISELSLEMPIFQPNIEIEKSRIPELAKYTRLGKFTGRQIMAVMEEIFNELGKNDGKVI
jgi:hypothetical protein